MIKEKLETRYAEGKDMILSLKKDIRKQAKRVHKETKKLYETLSSKKSSATYDTNAILLKLDGIESELKTLREVINREKEKAYIERIGKLPRWDFQRYFIRIHVVPDCSANGPALFYAQGRIRKIVADATCAPRGK